MNTPTPVSRMYKRRIFLLVLGLALLGYGLNELVPTLSALITGHSGLAEVVRVVKVRPGSPDRIITDDAQLLAESTTDRSWVFWNECTILGADGHETTVRMPVGGQLTALYPLRGPDGLPTALFVRYDPANPTHVAFPTVLGVWFTPGSIAFCGMLALASVVFMSVGSRSTMED